MPYSKYSTCKLNAKQVSSIIGVMLQEFLGTYFYDTGQTRPAVSIQKPAEDKRVEGLELVIDESSVSRNRDATWAFQVISRTDDSEQKLGECAELLRTIFSKGGRIRYQGADRTIDSLSRIIVVLPYGALLYWRSRLEVDPLLGT